MLEEPFINFILVGFDSTAFHFRWDVLYFLIVYKCLFKAIISHVFHKYVKFSMNYTKICLKYSCSSVFWKWISVCSRLRTCPNKLNWQQQRSSRSREKTERPASRRTHRSPQDTRGEQRGRGEGSNLAWPRICLCCSVRSWTRLFQPTSSGVYLTFIIKHCLWRQQFLRPHYALTV